MKVGDLVSLIMKKTSPPQEAQLAVVIEVSGNPFVDEKFFKPSQVKVLWQRHGTVSRWMCPTKFHEVLSEV